MITIFQNKRRKLVEEIGHYMNRQYSVYDNKGVLEVWFSSKQHALEWWSENQDRETYSERLNRERAERRALIDASPDLDEYEELPFM